MKSVHKSVLLKEVIEGLKLKSGSVVIDGTFGGGGHSAEILKEFPKVKIIALDLDIGALERGKEKFQKNSAKISFHNENFRNLDRVLASIGIEEVDGIVLDLGLSSDQLDNSGRGFSFMKDEPLFMTMKENPSPETLTAIDVVNSWSEESLGKIIRGYGEEKFWRRIAKAIAVGRKAKSIETTFDLVALIESAVPASYKRGRIHLATRTFQAIRIAVNDELGALQVGLERSWDALCSGGRMAVISFHSLEDRIVKHFYREKLREGTAILINKKPITASSEEISQNSRARSAKLRIIEKI